MITPRIHLVAFEERQGSMVFVAIPNERGRYIRTDKSVVQVSCSLCRATVGEPCKTHSSTGDGYGCGTHAVRRDMANRQFRGIKGEDLIEPADISSHGFPTERRPRSPGAIDLIEPRPIA